MLGIQVFTVESKKAATFTVEFQPHELGIFSHELHLRVNNNPFEQYKVALAGKARHGSFWWFVQCKETGISLSPSTCGEVMFLALVSHVGMFWALWALAKAHHCMFWRLLQVNVLRRRCCSWVSPLVASTCRMCT
jgi:hypothetical protein